MKWELIQLKSFVQNASVFITPLQFGHGAATMELLEPPLEWMALPLGQPFLTCFS
jgi:hypothetical protein